MEAKRKILVVDDEADLCEIVKFNLEMEGYEVSTAGSAEEALAMGVTAFDLLLLDVMMGGMSGFAMARRLKEAPETCGIPIIFLTAKDTENDTVTGFNLGADDYISKPFSLRELVARVKAVLRRTGETMAAEETETVGYERLVMHLKDKSVTVDGQEVAFTRTEFDLLKMLIANSGLGVFAPRTHRPRVAARRDGARPHGGREYRPTAKEDWPLCRLHRHEAGLRI